MSIIILDLDNTIADDSWRIPKINWQHSDPMRRYHDYHSLSAFDQPGNRDLFENQPHDIVVFTARPVAYHAVTEEWLYRNKIPARALLMRNNEDHRKSVELKHEQLNWLVQHYNFSLQDIAGAYDDRPDVVEMFVKLGIKAECRPIHNICAYTNPNHMKLN